MVNGIDVLFMANIVLLSSKHIILKEKKSLLRLDRHMSLKEGKAQGMAQGMAHGKDEANRENAKRMKDKGYSIEDIADITGLTTEMIEHL